ncbi:DUF1835 domain-containing protein [Aliiglaciecola sp. CAU 1673]|uniref:DUF1835 domain-containing protein n=1 Tax=Aliiglaciecola sp. CAU 1673 TaxID=3032595 RepID=UPI0023DA9A07|nr:DUF1835 domain-containing protein [Aliiglaciecola sp. CAU 1673]
MRLLMHLDTPDTLHIRCGSDIFVALRQAGITGKLLEFSDPFCQGPVKALGQVEFIAKRADFIASVYGLGKEETLSGLTKQYQALEQLGDAEQVVLWFEHDNYDQLILTYLLCRFSDLGLGECLGERLQLICIDHYPGIEPFHGIGQLGPEALTALWQQGRRPVTSSQLEDGQALWQAFSGGHIPALNAFLQQGSAHLPFMRQALKRQLQELPWADGQPGLTRQLVGQILSEQGEIKAGKVFRALMLEKEPLPHLGDLMFWALLQNMAACGQIKLEKSQAPWPQRLLSAVDQPPAATTDHNISWYVGPFDLSAPRCPRWDQQQGQISAP